MKKVLSIMLIILVVFSSLPMTVFGAENQDNSNDEFTYALSEDNAIITGYNGSDLFVDIPSEIDGHSVTEISSTTFKNDNSIVGIEIPNGVTTIGQGAFKNCLKAQYISLPATLKNIDTNTLTSNDDCVYIVERNSDAEKFVTENDMNYKKRFASDKVSESGQDDNISYRYNNLTSSLYVYGEGEIKNYNSDNQPWKNYKSTAKSIDLFDGITSIGNYAFYNFTSVTPEVTIPITVEKIGNSAFDCCTSLKKITIPDNVKIIGNRAFGSCTSVTEIELGTGLIQLGTDYRDYNNPFYYMTGVKKITFNSEKVPTTPYGDLFQYMNSLETVYVPAKSYSQYVERFSSYINNAKFVLLNDDTDFIIEDGVLKLYQGNDANVVIPSDVTEIGPSAFRNNASIKTVEFSSNVEKISNNAFMGCTSLKSVALNNKLTTISYSSFNSCSALKEITIPDSVETIGDYAFYKCTSLSNELVIPSSVTSIGNYAFAENNKIPSVDIKGNLNGTTVGDYSFQNVSNATSLNLGNVTSIGAYAFNNCTSLSGKLTIPDSISTIKNGAFGNCNSITEIKFSKNLDIINYETFSNCTSLKKITIPNNIKTIDNRAFYSCTGVTEIELGTGLIQLGTDYRDYNNPFYYMTGVKKITFNSEKVPTTPYGDLFQYMNNLETVYVPAVSYNDYVERFTPYINNGRILMSSNDEFVVSDGVLLQYTGEATDVTIPGTVEEISESAFKNNKKITSITIGESVSNIGKSVFSGCTALKSVKLTDKITTIDNYAFNGCTALTEITIPNSVETIGNYAFYKCTSLADELVIPSSVKTIGDYAFAEDNKITSITIKGNEDGTTIGNYSFQNATGIKSLDLGNVTSIGSYAFNSCTSLSGKLNIPDSISTIKNRAFGNCKSITEIKFSKNLDIINYETFSNCTSLKKITIPNNIKTIDNRAFYSCTGVTEIELGTGLIQLGTDYRDYNNPFYHMTGVRKITFNTEKVPTTPYADLFQYMNNLETVYVPVNGYSDYVAKYAPYINNANFVLLNNKEEFVVKDNVLLSYQGDNPEVTIPSGITEIGPSAFQNNKVVTKVTVSSDVEKVSSRSFLGCKNLTTVVLNNNLNSIGLNAFNSCTSLKSINLTDKITTIDNYAFNGCTALTEITIPNSVETIGNYAFYKCTSLTGELVIPSSVKTICDYTFAEDNKITSIIIKGNEDGTTIGNYSFQNNTSVKTLDLGNVTSIGSYAFNSCTSLSGKLNIPDSVSTIKNSAFGNCKSITEIKFSKNLDIINYETFSNCTSLKKITIPNNIKTIDNRAFYSCTGVTEIELGTGLIQLGTDYRDYNNPFYHMTGVRKITFNTEKVPTTPYADLFQYMNNLETVYVPVNGYIDYVARFSPYINNARIVMISDSDFVIKDGVLLQYSGNETDVIIPDNVTEIGDSAFKNNTNIKKVTFSKNIKKINQSAFYSCTNLETVIFNNLISSIGNSAFYGCTKLSGVLKISENTRSVGNYAFANCSSLSYVEIASNNEEIKIGDYSFQNDTSIKSISLGNVTSIGKYAFDNCKSINTKVQFNDSLKTIGEYAFRNCSNIIDTLVIPTSVITVATGAFQNCSSITNVEIPDSLTRISAYTFDGCKSLESIEVPDSVTIIDNHAFNNCSSVETVTLGKNVQTIGSYNNNYYNPFYGMNSVKEFTFKGDTLPSASFNDIFYSMNRLQTVYVTLKAYKSFGYTYSAYINNARYKVSGYKDDFIVNDKSELLLYQGNDTVVTIPENVETIEISAFQNNSTIEKVIFNENLKSISSYAFENCINLTSYEVNKNLENIGSRAFYGCTSLESVNLNNNLTTIGSSAFANCTSISGDLRVPSSVISIGSSAFDGDSSIVTLKIEGNKNGTSIGSYAFRNAKALTSLDLGSVETIGTYAFQNCTSLTGKLIIPDSVTSMGEGAFQNCSSITSLTLSEKLTAISRYAFANCSAIKGEIRIPDLVTDIYDNAFRNCKNVESVVLGTNIRNIGTSNYYYYSPFNEMTSVKEFMFTGTNVPNCPFEDLFYSMNSLETIFVPVETKDNFVDKFDKYKNNAVFSTDTMKCGVRNLSASNVYSKTVKLTWSRHQNDTVTSYIITRDGEQIATPKNNQFIDYDLTPNKTYEYTVYGVNDAGDKTRGTKLSVTPHSMDVLDITTPHSQNTVSVQDGSITVSAKNENNGIDLDGNAVLGKLYYFDKDNNKIFIGKSNAVISDKIYFNFDLNVEDIPNGEYKVLFTYTDIDNVTVEKEGTIRVDKSVPEKIQNVVALGDYNDIKISWSKSSEVDSKIYKIYRKSEVDTDFSLLTTIKGRDILSYTDTNVKKNRLYTYYVITENSFGIVSEKSAETIAMRGIDEEPPVITSITPSSYSYIGNVQKITVEATDNLMLGSAKLYYSTDEENWTLIDTVKNSPFTFAFNTKELTDTEISVKAVVYDLQGNESEPKIVKYKIDNQGPDKVTDFAISKVLSTKVTLKWKQPKAEDLASYVLEEKLENGNFKVVKDNITDNGYVIENLTPNTTHIYRVAGVDKIGNIGGYSDTLEVTTADDTTAPVVTSLSPSAGRRNSVINFSATAGDDYGIKSIEIQISTDLKTWKSLSNKEFTIASKTATYSFNVNVDEFNDGSIYVRAVATDFAGNVSDTSSNAPFVEYMIDKTAPSSPTNLVATSTDNAIYLTWLQGSEEDLSTYSVYRSTEKDSGFILLSSGLKQINYYDTTAKSGTVYYYKIAVTDTVGNVSEFSQTVSAKLAEDIISPEVVSISPNSNSSISKQFHTVSALVKDNYLVDTVTFEYKIEGEDNYKTFSTVKNINADYKTVSADIPLSGITNSKKVYVRVYCTDTSGLKSEYSKVYTYTYDDLAPSINNLKAEIKKNTVTLNWSDNKDSDLSGFKVYRIDEKGRETYLGSRQVSSKHSYEFYDTISSKSDSKYTYKVETYDESGNYSSTLSNTVEYKTVGDKENNEKPVARINGNEVMEKGVEEYFDGYSSTDDDSIVSYHWNFGDGTYSDDIQPIKSYRLAGTYEVKLTVTDSFGEQSTATFTVTVKERTAIGTVKVKVVDDKGRIIPQAPVYFNLGEDNQKVIYTDSNGYSSYNLAGGDTLVGCYKSGYLPVRKNVTVLTNATREITLTMIKEELVTGTFEVTRMTFNEIVDAGIDVYDPANQNIYSVEVTVRYGEKEIPIKYIRNDNKIIKYTVSNSGGSKPNENKPNGNGNSTISGISFIPNKENKEFIAILQFDATAKTLKEFFDVKLHIVNNATKDFVLTNNEVNLNVPDGLHLMDNVSGEWCNSKNVKFDKLVGQETKTLSWIVRGDKVGSYDLSADYSGVLSEFEETVKTSFKTDEPIDVYGMTNIMFNVEVCKEIRNNAFYFNIGLKNVGNIDAICPSLDFNNIVKNITSTALGLDPSDENYSPDFSVDARLMNVRTVSADNQSKYVDYKYSKDGSVSTNINTLAPDESIYFDYVAYNAINYDDIAQFKSASYKVLDGIGGGVTVTPIDFNYYSFANSTDKVNDLTSKEDNSRKSSADYLLNGNNFLYVKNSDMANSLGEGVYNGLKFALTIDFETLTKNDKKKLIDELLVKMITDDNSEQNINGLVSDQYVSAVKNALSVIESSCDSFDFGDNTTKEKVTTIISNALDSTNTINELAGNLENSTDEDSIINTFYGKLGLSAVGGISVTTFKKLVGDNLGYSENSALFKGITGVSEYGGMAVELLVENPINAYNDAVTSRYLYTQLKAQASVEQATLLLNTLISYYSDEERFRDFMKDSQLNSLMYKSANTNYKKLIADEAKKLKSQLLDDSYNFRLELAKNFASATANSVANIVLDEAISKSLGKLAIWYEALSATFQVVDLAFGIGDMYEAADSFAIANYISMAVESGYNTISNSYKNKNSNLLSTGLFNDIVSDDSSLNDDSLAEYTLYEMKSLCQIRLLGEQLFYKYINSDNSNIIHTDEEFDAKIIKEVNDYFGINAKNIEEVFDYVYEKILSSRDSIFDIESKESIIQPSAPTVTIDYNNLRTVEKFDDKYEYCTEDGVWHTCDGYINVYPKTVRTILRVRLKSSGNNMSGKITTVNVYAKKSVSKNVSVKYSDGKYYLTNLNENYSYQVAAVSSLTANADWSKAVTINNKVDATVTGLSNSDYLSIRILENKDLEVMTSEPTVLKVNKKLPLTIVTEGDGNVTQTSSDGYYFVGDDVTLTAEKSADSIFAGWYVNGQKVSSDPTYILEMTEFAEITAKFTGKTEVKATSINVTSPYTENKETFYVGEKTKLVANFTPNNTSNKSVKWTSSNNSVATVNNNGVVLFIKSGKAVITATTSNNISATYNINVVENKVEKLVITTDFSVKQYFEGETFCNDGLKLVAVYTDGSSSYIDDYTVTGFDNTKAGEQTLTIASNGKTVTTTVTVLHNGTWKVLKEATCKETGKMEYVCSICNNVVSEKTIEKIPHTVVIDKEVKPTCEKDGLTAGKHCSVCGEVITPQKTVPKLGHTVVKDKAVKPTYTHTGLTEGSHCSTCGKVIVAQKVVPKLKKTTITLKKAKQSVYVKAKTTVKATIKNPVGKTTYKSSNTKIAKVNSKGVITTYKLGTVKITVTNNKVSKTMTLVVKKPKLNKTSLTLKKNKSYTLKVMGKVGTAKFTSSNTKIVTVNKYGKILAKKKGNAIVSVKTNGETLKCKVKVN